MFSLLRDPRVRIALGIAGLEWLFVIALTLIGSADDFPLLIGFLSLAGVLQIGVLFYQVRGRGEVAEAQQLFMQGRFAESAAALEATLQASPTPDGQARTLLGNAYRQLGRLAESQQALETALKDNPNAAFPLYGLGRTLLAQGRYQEAADHISRALAGGGRRVIRAELALAHYLAGEKAAALTAAQAAARTLSLEPYRVLMVNYLLHQLADDKQALDMMARASGGLAYWQAEAGRFSESAYGAALRHEIEQMEKLLAKEQASGA